MVAVPGNQDCSWYETCEVDDLCKDCSKPASSPSCPKAPGCPKYFPYQTEVVKAVAPPQAPPKVGAIANGTCGGTTVGPDCNVAPKGSFAGLKTLASCVAKLKTCKMATYASFSLVANDCSWYDGNSCKWDELCLDCSKPGPSCPDPATGGCPHYLPFMSEVLRTPGSPPGPAPPGPPTPPGPPGPAPPTPPAPPPTPLPTANKVTVAVDWTSPAVTASTSATVEVDVMPFLSRSHEGGPFDAYMTALSNLGVSTEAPCRNFVFPERF